MSNLHTVTDLGVQRTQIASDQFVKSVKTVPLFAQIYGAQWLMYPEPTMLNG